MGKLITLLMCLMLVACNTTPSKIEIQKEEVPILYTPTPPTIPKAHLTYFDLSDVQLKNDGEVAKALRIDVITLTTYYKIFEQVLEQYMMMAQTNPDFSKLSDVDKKKLKDMQDKLNKIVEQK